MNTPGVKSLQKGLMLLVVILVGLVLLNLRRPTQVPAPTTLASVPGAPGPGAQRVGGVHIEQKKGDRVSFVLDAQSLVGQEQQELRLNGVSMSFPYVAQGEPGRASITSDECLYAPGLQKAVFQGHVVVNTRDGGRLVTDSLVYRGDKGLARTEAPVEFKRKGTSGRSTGMVYQAEEGRLALLADVFVRVEDAAGAPLEIRSAQAEGQKQDATLRFLGGVEVHQGPDSLKAQRLLVSFGEDQKLAGFMASDDVELRAAGRRPLPGMTGSAHGGGPRILKCERLDVSYRDGRVIEEATAGPAAELSVLPAAGEPRERHDLKAHILTFRFDEAGRLQEVQGQKDASLVSQAIPPARSIMRTITCRSFVATLDPGSGSILTVDFRRDVEITRGTQRSRSDSAWYEARESQLVLEKGPELLDLEDGGRLTAQHVIIGTESGDVTAGGGVTHVLGHKPSKGRPGLLLKQDTPTLVTCRSFEHQGRTRTTRYSQEALLRSGRDEIRAPAIAVFEERDGRRRLEATDGVVSLFHPREKPGKAPPAPVETRSRQLAYDEAKGEAVYTGDVVIRQGDIVTRSPEASVTLTPDGADVQTVVAGEPVEIEQGTRKATGKRGTYTPATETVVIVGEKVVLADPPQKVEGRSLTFHVGDDRVLVDGREEVRTETIIAKERPKP